MSDDGWKSDDGHDRGGFTDSPSSRGVPIYVLFLIMLGSGIFTLVFLWICVKCIYHKRRVRRARADLERNAAAAAGVEQAWELARALPNNADDDDVAKDGEVHVKRCDAGDVELTYVVMAGEEQPTFLAKPLRNPSSDAEEPVSASSPPTKLDDDHAPHDVPANPDKTSEAS